MVGLTDRMYLCYCWFNRECTSVMVGLTNIECTSVMVGLTNVECTSVMVGLTNRECTCVMVGLTGTYVMVGLAENVPVLWLV